jgi:HAD superfamily hydrolase (TIGR01509 family)
LLRTLCSETGSSASDSTINELVEERRARLAPVFDNIDDAIVEMIRHIKSMRLQVAVVSNASNADVAGWPTSRIGAEVEHFITSFEVGVLKPDPLIYQRAMGALEVHASEVVWVGDGSYNELAGAENVGMTPLWASWFLDRWPIGVRPGKQFEGGEWRQDPSTKAPFPRMKTTADLINWLSVTNE